jgi:type II secretory pathway pseudopilin PulG
MKTSGYKTLFSIFTAFLIFCIPVSALSASSDSKPADQLKKTTSDLVSATNKYKASVEALIPFYENALKAATETSEKRKELYAQGIISKRDLEAGEQAIKTAQSQLEQARRQITESDELIAEAKAEELAIRKPALPSKGAYSATATILRYSGSGGWTITQASNVQSFFASKFGRQLPVSAYGQSATHNRMGFDHRNSVDVALHPDSEEGKALIAYLRSNGIPFLAFRSAVPGAATGAHIHIGYPSHRIG